MIRTDSCAEMSPLVAPYAEGALAREHAARMDAHLRACPECRKRLERFRAVRGCLRGTVGPETMDASFAEETGRRLREVSTGPLAKIPHEESEAPQPAPEGFLDALAGRFGAAPWWAISGAFHALLLLLLALIGMAIMRSTGKDTVILTSLEKKLDPPDEEKPKEREIFKNPVPVELPQTQTVESPVVMHEEVEIAEHNETANDADAQDAFGDEGISDIPLGGSGFSGAIGIGGGGSGAFGRPNGAGGRLRRAAAGGGGKATESAVDAALDWLARHQEADGRWDSAKHEGKNFIGAVQPGHVDAGVTGLALLAFLGAGHTETVGKYRDHVQRAVAWIVSKQAADGSIGREYAEYWHEGAAYHHAICGLALAEAAGMGKRPATLAAAQKAVDYSTEIHQQKKDGHSERGAWRYRPNAGMADASVSGWFVMQLKSAKMAGLAVAPACFEGALAFYDSIEDKPRETNGYKGGIFPYSPQHRNVVANPTAIGLLCNLFLGRAPDEIQGGIEYLAQNPPKWDKSLGKGKPGAKAHTYPFYYTYYATLTMFQAGAGYWRPWNEALKQMLLPNQRRGGDENGSWDPVLGSDDEMGGRVYSTAMGALCLEVYYRYLPITR